MNANPGLSQHRRLAGWARGLFWGWNVVFLAFVIFGFAPLKLPIIVMKVQEGVTPPIFLVYTLVIIAIPLLTTLIGVFFLRKEPYRLFALGYVLEWPLLLIMIFRFFFIMEGNPAITVLLVWLAAAEAVFLWHLLDKKIDERSPFWRSVRLAGLTLLFVGTIYGAVWLAFYVPLFASLLYQSAVNISYFFGDIFRNWSHWYDIPLAILGYILFLFSGILLVTMPVPAPILAGRAWLHSLRSVQKTSRRLASSWLAALLPLALVLAVLAVSMRQPQHTAFRLLEESPASQQEAQALLDREEQIRAGLLNAYLASFRYLSSQGEVRHIADAYRFMLNTPQETAWRIEQAYELLLRPFLYDPVRPASAASLDNQTLANEQQEAAMLYQRFFDMPIAQGERKEIVNAVRSTSNVDQAELAWQAVDNREVHLNRQEVTLSEHGDWADVLIHEVYENRTFQRQEVVYYFSLPESAVITGLWLGNTANRNQAFAFQVAPRGAAQAVYRNEVRYLRDPALVEQIGPRQYRLRAFPVEPRQSAGGSEIPESGPELHLWMAYRTMTVDGAWPLPQLAEKFNVFWDARSVRSIDGQTVPANNEVWLPDAITPSGAVERASHRVDFPDGVSVVARPAAETSMAALPSDLRLAIVLDRSYSMRVRADEVRQTLDSLKQMAGSAPDVDVYLTASAYRGENPSTTHLASLDPQQVLFFGGQNAAELLAQYEELSAGKQYDLVLVLTDASGYELGEGNIHLRAPDAPVWLVHLGGGFPMGYDDATQQAIQASGGGVTSTVEEALARYALSREAPGRIDEVDGYVWEVMPTGDVSAQTGIAPVSMEMEAGAEDAGFAALAVRRVILAEMARNRDQLDQLPALDRIHHLAVEQGIVTPYSSMLVLVNDHQQRLLDELSEMDDRYQREVENIGLTASASPFAVTGVPEPEEWLLLITAGLALAYVAWRRLAQRSATA